MLASRRTDVYREPFLRQPQPVWIFDVATLRILDVNDAACAAYGYTRTALLRMSTDDLRPSSDIPNHRADVRALVANGRREGSGVWRHRRADGSVFYADTYAGLIDFNGRRACLVLAIDASSRIAVSRALTESRAALTEAQELAHLGSFDTDFWTGEIRWSPEMFRLLGVDPASGRPSMLHEFDHPDDAETIRAELARARSDREPYTIEHRVVNHEGHIRHVCESGRFYFEEGSEKPRRAIGVMLDITERKLAEERLRHLAGHDALTQLPNRTLSSARLIAAIDRAAAGTHNVAVFFLDVDRFKAVNDAMAHPAGDRLLRELAVRLRESIGSRGVVGRPGGDEFIVVIEKVDGEDEAMRVAADMLEAISRPLPYDDEHQIAVTASIGVALYPRDGTTPDELLSGADIAMYAAKANGGNTARPFAPQLRRTTLAQLELERALRAALDRDALEVAYQPIVDATSGALVSFEALVRWTENGEIIEPSHFIPLAESTGLIVRLGTFVLQRACAQARLWLDARPDLAICVNISPHQFRDPAFLGCVEETLAETGLAAERLQLEITESAYMGADAGVANIRNLKDAGVGFSIDDFGTGYSSLGYLKRLPVDALKIDRSFVSDIVSDAADQAIVRAIIAVAKNLGLSIIAEGVETLEQAELLAAFGCTYLQGYYFARPLTPEAATAFIG